MLDSLLSMCRGSLEPEITMHFPVGPESVRNAADKSEGGGPGAGLAVSDDFLDEPFVLGSFAIVQWRVFHDLTSREPDKRLRTYKAAREIEVYFVWESTGEDLVEVLWDIAARWVVRVMAWAMGTRGIDRQREGHHCAFGR